MENVRRENCPYKMLSLYLVLGGVYSLVLLWKREIQTLNWRCDDEELTKDEWNG
jgi:hypothetical protein